MLKTKQILYTIFALMLLWQCDAIEPETNTFEADILAVLMADDSTFTLDGFENEDFDLSKITAVVEQDEFEVMALMDSNSVWRFGRSNMNVEREYNVTEIDDSTASAQVIQHVTGIFHAREFQRVWIDDTTWVRGDSIQFSEKEIDMSYTRNVLLNKGLNRDGEEHWFVVGVTASYGETANTTMGIESFAIHFGDSTRTYSDFLEYYFNRENAIRFFYDRYGRIDAMISNDIAEQAESVRGIFGGHPRLAGLRQVGFRYMGTEDNGEKVYSQLIIPDNHPNRFKRGQIHVVDFRTLFDHSYTDYNSVGLSLMYRIDRPPRP